VQRASKDGNREMIFEEIKEAKCLPIWSSFDKFALGIKATQKLKHKKEENEDLSGCRLMHRCSAGIQ